MTELATDPASPSDAELIAQVRGGDVEAYGVLFDRHREAAHRLARQLVRGSDSDDLVSEAFAKVLQVLQSGGGPDVAFRAYLLTAVRRLHVDRVRATAKVQVSDEVETFDPGIPFQDTAVEGFERRTTSRAFASLPERWQLVLWHLEVEGQKPAEIAPLLGMSPNSVAALAYRAREGLRQAYLQMHLADTADDTCRWTSERLGGYVRDGLSKRETGKVEAHLDECRRCAAVYLELVEVNSNLRGLLAPLLLGGAATGYLATSAAGVGGLGVAPLLQRATDSFKSAGQGAVVAAAAGMVAAGAVFAALVAGGDDPPTESAEPGTSAPSTGGGGGGSGGGGGGGGGDGSDQQPAAAEPPDSTTPPESEDEPTPTAEPSPSPTPVPEPSETPTTEPPDEPTPTEPPTTEPPPDEPTPTEPPPSEPPPPPPTTEPPGPPEADVGVYLSVDSVPTIHGPPPRKTAQPPGPVGAQGAGPPLMSVAFRGTVSFSNTEDATLLRAIIDPPDGVAALVIFDNGGWTCSVDSSRQVQCTGPGSAVGDIRFFMTVPPPTDPTTSAAVDILSNEVDPNRSNNKSTWSP